MFYKIKSFFEENIIFIAIITIFLVIFCINYPYSSYLMGGDSMPIFYSNYFITKQLYIRTSTISYGAVSTQSNYILLMPLIGIINGLSYIFGMLNTQFIFYMIFFLLIPIGMFGLLKTLGFDNKSSAIGTFFYGLNFLLRQGLVRNVLPISYLFILTPVISYTIIKYGLTGNKKYILILILISLINGYIISNPRTFLVQIIVIMGLYIYKFGNQSIIRLLLGLIFSYIVCIPGVITMFVMLLNSSTISTDERNNVILIKQSLLKESYGSVLLNSLRGYNSDIFSYRGYIDATKNDNLFYPFPFYNLLKSNLYNIISFIPILLIIIGIIGNKYKNKIIYILILFIFTIFVFKSAAYPFGEAFQFCITKVPLCGIFRSPHQKISIIFLILSIILLLKYRNSASNSKKIYIDAGLILYIAFMALPFLASPIISQKNIVSNIPDDYKKTANYINIDNSIKNIIFLPFNESTRTNTSFGYEGYSILSYLLPQKQIYNRNDLSFSKKASDINKLFASEKTRQQGGLVKALNQLKLDTIIYDGYTDRYSRFKIQENHKGNIEFIKNEGLILDKKFGEIYIFKKSNKDQSIINSSKFSKINPTKYRIKVSGITGSTDLSFLQSFHNERKLFPDKSNKLSANCQMPEKYNSYIESGIYITGTNHTVLEGETLYTIAKNYNSGSRRRESDYIYDINNLSGATVTPGQNLIIQPETYPEMIQTATGNITECIQSGYTFYEGEELSYLRAKPLREDNHHLVYDYANGRNISLTGSTGQAILQQGLSEGRITTNLDGSYDISLILYFRPQSWFYLGLGISGSTFLALLIWLVIASFRKRDDEVI